MDRKSVTYSGLLNSIFARGKRYIHIILIIGTGLTYRLLQLRLHLLGGLLVRRGALLRRSVGLGAAIHETEETGPEDQEEEEGAEACN